MKKKKEDELSFVYHCLKCLWVQAVIFLSFSLSMHLKVSRFYEGQTITGSFSRRLWHEIVCFVITAIIILRWWDIWICLKKIKYENGYLCMYSLLMPTSWRIPSLQVIKHEIFTSVDFDLEKIESGERRWWTMLVVFICMHSKQTTVKAGLAGFTLPNLMFWSCVEAFHTSLKWHKSAAASFF